MKEPGRVLSSGYVCTRVVPRHIHRCVNGLRKVSSSLGAAQGTPDLRLEPISTSSPHVVLMICPWEQWVWVTTVPSQAVRHQPGAGPQGDPGQLPGPLPGPVVFLQDTQADWLCRKITLCSGT